VYIKEVIFTIFVINVISVTALMQIIIATIDILIVLNYSRYLE